MRPNRFFAICEKVPSSRLVRDTLFRERFQLWGWAGDEEEAHKFVLDLLVQKGRRAGVINDMRRQKVGLTALESETSWSAWCLSRDRKVGQKMTFLALTAFDILKWKSNEGRYERHTDEAVSLGARGTNPNQGAGHPHQKESTVQPPNTSTPAAHKNNAPCTKPHCGVQDSTSEVTLKYRDAISFSRHLLKPWAKLLVDVYKCWSTG